MATRLVDNKNKKKAFIEAYKKSFGNITQSCKAVDISRECFYKWLKEEDGWFKKKIEAVEPDEIFIDFAENALAKRIQKEDTKAIIFALKTKGKKRGYIEKQEVDMSGKIDLGVVYLPPKSDTLSLPEHNA